MLGLTAWAWLALVVSAVGIGFSKTAVGGVASVAVAVFATLVPVKQSTAIVLALLLVGDVVAVSLYHRDVDWRLLLRLVPPVCVGLVAGAFFLNAVPGQVLKVTIAIVLLAMVAIYYARELIVRRTAHRTLPPESDAGEPGPAVTPIPVPKRGSEADSKSGAGGSSRAAALGYGALAGFTTMVANSGGAVMTVYLTSARFPMMRFLGTGAWFFFCVNLLKMPVSIGLGLFTGTGLAIVGILAPAVLVGTWLGRLLIKRIDQRRFTVAVMAATVLSAIMLLV